MRQAVRGFTLVELLVVIAIIGVLIALLLPAIQAAREAARRQQCQSNLRQVSLGLLNYESSKGAFPSAFDFTAGENPADLADTRIGPNWAVRLLPFIEQAPLFARVDLRTTAFISHANNAQVREAVVPSLRCPSDSFAETMLEIGNPARGGSLWARGNYAVSAGNGPLLRNSLSISQTRGIWGPDSPGWLDRRFRGVMGPAVSVKLKEITDGLSNSILLGEVRAGISQFDRRGTWALGQAGASMIIWYGTGGDDNGPNVCSDYADDVAGPLPTDADVMKRECMPDWTGDNWNNQATARSAHVGGVNLGMADGSAHFISNDVDVVPPPGAVGGWGSVWDRLIASADDESIQDMPF
jgi:prepilin-type N-terminal cleavage/methylation domain-containing protein